MVEKNRDNRDKRERAVILENARSPPLKQGDQKLYWCFTFNNYTEEEIELLETIFRVEAEWYVFQEEVGEEKTPHLQGTFKLIHKARLTQLKKLIPGDPHLEPTHKVPNSIIYCCNWLKRAPNGRIFSNNVQLPDCAEPILVEEPYGWQLDVIDILKTKPDKRTIFWFWETKGGVGKSSLAKYLAVKYQANIISGKSQDIFNAVKNAKSRKLFIIDVPRSAQDFINYGAIEQVKNGLLYSGKYEGGQVVFNCPHVIVFANERPDFSKMSKDRWDVREIYC